MGCTMMMVLAATGGAVAALGSWTAFKAWVAAKARKAAAAFPMSEKE